MKREKQKNKPTAPVIVARLSNSFGGRIALLFKVDKPYEHYTLSGEEVPYGAIESWQEVNLPTPESEDEKIRKGLIEALKTSKTVGELNFILPEPTREECIAYLEKQKEHLTPEEKMNHPLYLEGFDIGKRVGEVTGKSAEWSEEDEEKINNIFEIIEHCAAIPYSGGTLTLSKEYKKELQCFIKSLRPQPKQKVNNMITPNKEFFQWIYDRLVNVHKENPNVDYMISFKRRIEELSFDEPHWKPIEEQMKWLKEKMLEDVIEAEVENASVGIVYLRKNLVNEGYSTGDKVKIIIVPEKEDKK